MSEPIKEASPTNLPVRLSVDVTVLKTVVDCSLRMLAAVAGRMQEAAWQELATAAEAQHLEIALAEFRARLPKTQIRNGSEPLSAAV